MTTTITIDLPDRQAAVLAARAKAQGLTLEDWFRRVAEGPEAKAHDWSQCPVVVSNPCKRSGAWVFKDARMPVSLAFKNLELGATVDEIREWHDLSREQIGEVLAFAARSLDAPGFSASAEPA